MRQPILEFVFQLAFAAVLAVIVALVDEYTLGLDLPWWGCAAVGVALVFGGVFIVRVIDDA